MILPDRARPPLLFVFAIFHFVDPSSTSPDLRENSLSIFKGRGVLSMWALIT